MTITLDRETHRYFEDGKLFAGPSATAALAQCGIADFSHVEEELRQRSMARGISVHWMTMLSDQKALNVRRLPWALKPYRTAWVSWLKASGFIPMSEWTERSFIDRVLGYAGTVDRVGTFPLPDGSRSAPAVLDIKTGGTIYEWVKYQLALYAHHCRAYRRIAVLLRKNATYAAKEFPFREFNQDFAVAFEAVRRWRPAMALA